MYIAKKGLWAYLLFVLCFSGCECVNEGERHINNNQPAYTKVYRNLEAINLDLKPTEGFTYRFNGKELKKEGDLWISEDLVVYCNTTSSTSKYQGNLCATVIGSGGIISQLEIFDKNGNLVKSVGITTSNQVLKYEDALGPEWPGIHNIGNTCYANSVFKLIARCSGYDEDLQQDIPSNIHTTLRNIVNGIRLGHGSAMWEVSVNNLASRLLLDKLNECIGNKFPIGTQATSVILLRKINFCLYSKTISQKITQPELIPELVNAFRTKRPVFKRITKTWSTPYNTVRQYNDLPIFLSIAQLRGEGAAEGGNTKCLTLPQFFICVDDSGPIKKKIEETLQVPIWDVDREDTQVGEKTYKLIGFLYHQGTRTSGHYVAHVKFGNDWYLHNDSSVSKVAPLEFVNSLGVVSLYECVE
jgi:hypothetical protein